MVSALLKACSEGNLSAVQELLKDANTLDIEARDDSGSTPLIEAIRNGQADIVRALLDRGADPLNASPNGLPEQHTSDQVILNLLAEAKNKLPPKASTTESTFNHDGSDDTQKGYYPPPPPEAYPYYPTINPSLSTADGAVYYPPAQPVTEGHSPGGGLNNLPPPEIARLIPCRYFPACRYGPSCMFAHPPQGYYSPGVPPHAQYPPYEPMAPPPYPPNYYPMQPPQFQPPNGPHPMTPISPSLGPHHIMHARSQSEVVSPSQGPFSPNGVPPPPLPYGPMSPTAYPHPGQIPVPIPPIPPLHHPSTMHPPGPQSPTNFAAPNTSPYGVPQDNSTIYSPQHPPLSAGPMNYSPENNDGAPKPPQVPSNDGLNNNHVPPMHRDGAGHARRGGRRGSFTSRKPPCLFYPSGRCKNGDDCRFPHVMPDALGAHHPSYFTGRGGGPRQPRGHPAGNGNANGGLEEKFNNLNIRDESSRQQQAGSASQPQQTQQNGQSATTTESSKSSNASDSGHGIPNGNGNGINGMGHRPRFPPGGKHHQYHQHHGHNNHHGKGQKPPAPVPVKQRVPNADEFPVLAGTVTPPSKTSLNGNGLTAAQVLQAPPPSKKDAVNGTSRESSTRGTTPDAPRSPAIQQHDSLVKAEVNGIADNATTTEPPVGKLPMSFAAAAAPSAASTSTPDVSKEVSVSA